MNCILKAGLRCSLAVKLAAAIVTSVAIGFSMPAGAKENPKNRIDFWENNYNELRLGNTPLAERAHKIFGRVLNAAGRRPGVMPELFIIDIESDLMPLAVAIPDGTVTTLPGCKRATNGGISQNDSSDKVAGVYGPPEERILLSRGEGCLS